MTKALDSSKNQKIIADIERLAKDCGYTWYRGQHPDEQISVLLTVFAELRAYKRGLGKNQGAATL